MDQSIAITSTAKPTQKSSSFEREGWWRTALTNTPNPGTYHLKTFIEESLLNPVIATYNFKNEGRKKPPLLQRNDPVLNDLPQYMPPDFLDLLKKQVATYSFKDKPRSSPSMLVYRDQELRISFYGSKVSNRLLHSSSVKTSSLKCVNHLYLESPGAAYQKNEEPCENVADHYAIF